MHTHHLLAASCRFAGDGPLVAQPQYAWVGTYNPNGEGLYRFTRSIRQTGALDHKTRVSTLANPRS